MGTPKARAKMYNPRISIDGAIVPVRNKTVRNLGISFIQT